MNDATKTWLTSIIAVLALVGVGWGHVEPMATWLVANAGIMLARPQVQMVLTSMSVGILLSGAIPHSPFRSVKAWSPDFTKAVTRGVCFAITFVCALALSNPANDVEWRTAIVYALLSGGCGMALWTTLAGFVYRVAPRPESLK